MEEMKENISTSKNEIRIRVERLLKDKAVPRDLDRIFSWVRFKSFGISSVREVADFANHVETRNQGPVRADILNFVDVIAFFMESMGAQRESRPPRWSLDLIASAARGNFELLGRNNISSKIKLSKKSRQSLLNGALDKLYQNPNGEICFRSDTSPLEYTIFEECLSVLCTLPVFSDIDLAKDLSNVLLKNNVLEKHEKAAFLRLSGKISLFAIEKMHLTKVEVPGQDDMTLRAGPNFLGPQSCIQVSFDSMVSYPVFTTSSVAHELVSDVTMLQESRWTSPLELGDDWKLRFL